MTFPITDPESLHLRAMVASSTWVPEPLRDDPRRVALSPNDVRAKFGLPPFVGDNPLGGEPDNPTVVEGKP